MLGNIIYDRHDMWNMNWPCPINLHRSDRHMVRVRKPIIIYDTGCANAADDVGFGLLLALHE